MYRSLRPMNLCLEYSSHSFNEVALLLYIHVWSWMYVCVCLNTYIYIHVNWFMVDLASLAIINMIIDCHMKQTPGPCHFYASHPSLWICATAMCIFLWIAIVLILSCTACKETDSMKACKRFWFHLGILAVCLLSDVIIDRYDSNSAFYFSSHFGFEALPNISGTNLLWRCNTAKPLARFRWAESGLQGAKRMPKYMLQSCYINGRRPHEDRKQFKVAARKHRVCWMWTCFET